MATTKILLENRRAKIAQPQIVKIRIYHNLKTALISLEIKLLPSQWSESLQMVINHPEEKILSEAIRNAKSNVDSLISSLDKRKKLDSMSVVEVKNYVESIMYPERQEIKEQKSVIRKNKNNFASRFLTFAVRARTVCLTSYITGKTTSLLLQK